MSGGRFDYVDMHLKNEIFDFREKPYNVFEDMEISELVFDVLDLIHEFDWYASGDTCEETWLKEKGKFKRKWFETVREDRIKRIVDEALNDTKDELYKAFQLVEE